VKTLTPYKEMRTSLGRGGWCRNETALPGQAMRGRGGRGFGRNGFGRRGEGEPGEGREGRGRRRMFDSGELRLVILLLIEAEPRHGYDLIREIETRTGGAYAPSPGVVYPTLALLEDVGHAEARASEGAKKLFAITPAGVAHLNDNRSEAEAALARLDALARKDEALDTGPVFRAMSNLKAALRMRLAGAPDKPLLFAVADAIDEAARKIERL
jgi:DNA-binding PadR family transcriptional regulator